MPILTIIWIIWRRRVTSHQPDFIRSTQWIFLRFLERGLAYKRKAPVNWCPGCQTVLANEQVLADGTCERSGDVVETREPVVELVPVHREDDVRVVLVPELDRPAVASRIRHNDADAVRVVRGELLAPTPRRETLRRAARSAPARRGRTRTADGMPASRAGFRPT